jgi:hypothetical protein
MTLAFPNTYSNGTFYQYDPGVGEPRFWRYNGTTGTWRSVPSYIHTYNRYGSLAPNTGIIQFLSQANLTITNIYAVCGNPPLNGNINISVLKDGSNNVANLTISGGNTTSPTVNYYSNYASFTVNTGDNLTINLGPTNASYYGNNLSVYFRYVYT